MAVKGVTLTAAATAGTADGTVVNIIAMALTAVAMAAAAGTK